MRGKGPLCSWRKGPGGIPLAVSLLCLEDALEKLHFTPLAVAVSRESFCIPWYQVQGTVSGINSTCMYGLP